MVVQYFDNFHCVCNNIYMHEQPRDSKNVHFTKLLCSTVPVGMIKQMLFYHFFPVLEKSDLSVHNSSIFIILNRT